MDPGDAAAMSKPTCASTGFKVFEPGERWIVP
jgi:hypothetical protein